MDSPQGSARVLQFVTRHALMVVILLLCVLFALALGSSPRGTGVSLPTVEPTALNGPEGEDVRPAPVPTPTPTAAPTTGRPPAAFGYVLGALLVLTVFTLLWWLIRLMLRARTRRRRVRVRPMASELEADGDEAEEQAVRDEMRSAVEEGLRETDSGDPRRAVIGCWVRLEQAAASAGTHRRPGDTPADLMVRLLDGHEVSSEALDRLAELYRRARYAPDDVAESMRDEARNTLSELASALSGTST